MLYLLVDVLYGKPILPLKLFSDPQEAERYAESVSRGQVIDAATNIQKRDISKDGDIIHHQPCFKDFT